MAGAVEAWLKQAFFDHGEIVRTMMGGRRRRECQLVGQLGEDDNDRVEDEGRVKLLW